MSSHWSWWIMFLVVLNLGITLFLFVWGTRVHIPTRSDGTTGHVWAHGTVREGVRKLPAWWYWMSVLMFIAAFSYLLLYPGFGSYPGLLGWTSQGQLEEAVADNQTRLAPLMERAAETPPSELASDADATQMGGRLYQDNCAACHGLDARGNTAIGAPDLLDSQWLYGGDDASVLTSIKAGRSGLMPGWEQLGEETIRNLAHHVRKLSGQSHDASAASVGKATFAACAGCHGADGTGNPAMGAPNLTDDAWLYGGDLSAIMASISEGRQGKMPGWDHRLEEAEIHLIAAWMFDNADP